jgi:hypothetical protein
MLQILLAVLLALPAQDVKDAVQKISRNVQHFQESLPDFVCTEEITSTSTLGAFPERRTVKSIFTGLQRPSGKLSFSETREVIAIDGRDVPPRTVMPALPSRFDGLFSSVKVMTFSPAALKRHKYKRVSGTVIAFETNASQPQIRYNFEGRSFEARYSGTATIDPESMQIARLEIRFLNIPSTWETISTAVDYAEFEIGDSRFWMPKKARTELRVKKKSGSGVYMAEYSDCRKFTSSVEIKAIREE